VSTPVPAESLAAKLKFARETITKAAATLYDADAILDKAVTLLHEVEKDLDADTQAPQQKGDKT
jgi:hypothetical protein